MPIRLQQDQAGNRYPGESNRGVSEIRRFAVISLPKAQEIGRSGSGELLPRVRSEEDPSGWPYYKLRRPVASCGYREPRPD
jgi:hypothetical protein